MKHFVGIFLIIAGSILTFCEVGVAILMHTASRAYLHYVSGWEWVDIIVTILLAIGTVILGIHLL